MREKVKSISGGKLHRTVVEDVIRGILEAGFESKGEMERHIRDTFYTELQDIMLQSSLNTHTIKEVLSRIQFKVEINIRDKGKTDG